MPRQTRTYVPLILASVALTLDIGCSSSNFSGPSSGGSIETGGALVDGGAAGAGGSIESSGKPGSGGTIGAGGTVGAGGTAGSGGAARTGGTAGMATTGGGAGTTGIAGTTAVGGVTAIGGASAVAGTTSSAGGTTAIGGASAVAGTTSSVGGTTATGGVAGSGGDTGSGGSTGGGEYGFTYLTPGSVSVTCGGEVGSRTMDEPDEDWLCTFHHGTRVDYVYARASATGECLAGLYVPKYKLESAEISVDGVVTALANGQYEFGGNHHNDSLSFEFEGQIYKYSHSSLGYGGRCCQPMDCTLVYVAGSSLTVETNGCTAARTRPEVCVPIKADRTHAPLTPDPFKKCPGDPNL